MKYFLSLFIIFMTTYSYASENIVLKFREKFFYKIDNPISVTPFVNRDVIEYDIKENGVYFFGSKKSVNTYQIITPTEVKIVLIKVTKDLSESSNIKNAKYKGFIGLNNLYRNSDSGDSTFHSLRSRLRYNFKKDSYFESRFLWNSADFLEYYLKRSKNGWFLGHGHKNISPDIFPIYYRPERLLLTEVGYESNNFNLSLWGGEQNRNINIFNKVINNDVFGIQSDFTKDNHKLSLDYFVDPQNSFSAPYLTYKYNSDKYNLRYGLGGTEEKILSSLNFVYTRPDEKKTNFGLDRLNIVHDYSENGFEQLFFVDDSVNEVFNLNGLFNKKDLPFSLRTNFQRVIRGSFQQDTYGLGASYLYDNKIRLGLNTNYSDNRFSQSSFSNNFLITPSIQYNIINNFKNQYYLRVYQTHIKNELRSTDQTNSYTGFQIKNERIKFDYLAEIAREYRANGSPLGLENFHLVFNAKYRPTRNFSLSLNNRIISDEKTFNLRNLNTFGTATYNIDRKHFFSLAFNTRINKNEFTTRNTNIVKFNYTYRFKGNKSPVKNLFSPNRLSGLAFQDLNSNGLYDSGEMPLSNAEIIVSTAGELKRARTNKKGKYKIKGLDKANYSVDSNSKNKILKSTVQNKQVSVDKKTNLNIPFMKLKEFDIKVFNKSSNDLEIHKVLVKCKNGYKHSSYSGINSKSKTLMPLGQICSVSIDFNEQDNIKIVKSIKQKNTEDFLPEETITISQENTLLITAFEDLNKDNELDFDEELEGLKVLINKKEFKTDYAGEILFPVKTGVYTIETNNKTLKCNVSPRKISVNSREFKNYTIKILCTKK